MALYSPLLVFRKTVGDEFCTGATVEAPDEVLELDDEDVDDDELELLDVDVVWHCTIAPRASMVHMFISIRK